MGSGKPRPPTTFWTDLALNDLDLQSDYRLQLMVLLQSSYITRCSAPDLSSACITKCD